MSFQKRVQAINEHLRSQQLAILIWGPPPNSPGYELRQHIRQNLASEFYNSEVLLSDELEAKDILSEELPIRERELLHVAASDLVIVVVGSQGSLAEVDTLINSIFGHKFLLIVHEHLKDNLLFSNRLRSKGSAVFYSGDDLKSGNILEVIATRVRQVALAKMVGLEV